MPNNPDRLGQLYDVLKAKRPQYVEGGTREEFITKFSDSDRLGKLYDIFEKSSPELVEGGTRDEFVKKFLPYNPEDTSLIGGIADATMAFGAKLLGIGDNGEYKNVKPTATFWERAKGTLTGASAEEVNIDHLNTIEDRLKEKNVDIDNANKVLDDPSTDLASKKSAYMQLYGSAQTAFDDAYDKLKNYDNFDFNKYESAVTILNKFNKDKTANPDLEPSQQVIEAYNFIEGVKDNKSFLEYQKQAENLRKSNNLKYKLFPEQAKLDEEHKLMQLKSDAFLEESRKKWGIAADVVDGISNVLVNTIESAARIQGTFQNLNLFPTLSEKNEWIYGATDPDALMAQQSLMDKYEAMKSSESKGNYKEDYVNLGDGRLVVYQDGKPIYGRTPKGFMFELSEDDVDLAEKLKEQKGLSSRRNTTVLKQNLEKAAVDFVGQIVLAKGLNSAGVTNTTAAVVMSTAAMTYGDYFRQAVESGASGWQAFAEAGVKSGVEGMLENIGGLEAKLLGKGVPKKVLRTVKADLKAAMVSGKLNAKNFLGEYFNYLGKYVASGASEVIKQGVMETIEEVSQNLSGDMLDNLVLNTNVDPLKNAVRSFEETGIISFTLGAGASLLHDINTAHKNYNSNLYVNALSQMLQDPQKSIEIINNTDAKTENKVWASSVLRYVGGEILSREIAPDNLKAVALAAQKLQAYIELEDEKTKDDRKEELQKKIAQLNEDLDNMPKGPVEDEPDEEEPMDKDEEEAKKMDKEQADEEGPTSKADLEHELIDDIFGPEYRRSKPEEGKTTNTPSWIEYTPVSSVLGNTLVEDGKGNRGYLDITPDGDLILVTGMSDADMKEKQDVPSVLTKEQQARKEALINALKTQDGTNGTVAVDNKAISIEDAAAELTDLQTEEQPLSSKEYKTKAADSETIKNNLLKNLSNNSAKLQKIEDDGTRRDLTDSEVNLAETVIAPSLRYGDAKSAADALDLYGFESQDNNDNLINYLQGRIDGTITAPINSDNLLDHVTAKHDADISKFNKLSEAASIKDGNITLGNISELGDASLAALNLKKISIEGSGKIYNIGDRIYVIDDPDSAVEYTSNGKIRGVKIIEPGKGARFLVGVEAEELAYRLKLEQLNERHATRDFGQALGAELDAIEETPEPSNVGKTELAPEGGEKLPESIRPGTVFTTKEGDRYTVELQTADGKIIYRYYDPVAWLKAELDKNVKGWVNPNMRKVATLEEFQRMVGMQAQAAAAAPTTDIAPNSIRPGTVFTSTQGIEYTVDGYTQDGNVRFHYYDSNNRLVRSNLSPEDFKTAIGENSTLGESSAPSGTQLQPGMVFVSTEKVSYTIDGYNNNGDIKFHYYDNNNRIVREIWSVEDFQRHLDAGHIKKSKKTAKTADAAEKAGNVTVTDLNRLKASNPKMFLDLGRRLLKKGDLITVRDANGKVIKRNVKVLEVKNGVVKTELGGQYSSVPLNQTENNSAKDIAKRVSEETEESPEKQEMAKMKEVISTKTAQEAKPVETKKAAPVVATKVTEPTKHTEEKTKRQGEFDSQVQTLKENASQEAGVPIESLGTETPRTDITTDGMRQIQEKVDLGLEIPLKNIPASLVEAGDIITLDNAVFQVLERNGDLVTLLNQYGEKIQTRVNLFSGQNAKVLDVSFFPFQAKGAFNVDAQVASVKKALSKILPDVTIEILSDEEYKKRIKDGSKANYTRKKGKVTILINRNKAINTTVYHEATHAVLLHFFQLNDSRIHTFHNTIIEVMRSFEKSSPEYKEMADHIQNLVNKYTKSGGGVQAHEYLAELTGYLSANRMKLRSPSFLNQLLDKLNNVLEDLIGVRPFNKASDIVDVINMFNNLAVNLRQGNVIADDLGPVNTANANMAQVHLTTPSGHSIGYKYDTELAAEERFALDGLPLISTDNPNIDTYRIENGKILKVAKTTLGLEQNLYEGDRRLSESGITPKIYEAGLNYVVSQEINTAEPSIEVGKELKSMLKDIEKVAPKTKGETPGEEFYNVLAKYGLSEVFDYDINWSNFTASNNWGFLGNSPVYIGPKTFGKIGMLSNYAENSKLGTSEFREIYYRNRDARKEAADRDDITMSQLGDTFPEMSQSAAFSPEKASQLSTEGTGIQLSGTEPIKTGANAPTVKNKDNSYSDDYSLDDILNTLHAPNSRVVSLAEIIASGVLTYAKKNTIVLPYINTAAAKKIKTLKNKYSSIPGKNNAEEAAKQKLKKQINEITKKVISEFSDVMSQNLLALYDSLTPEFIQNSKEWYVGANRMINSLASDYGISIEQAAGIVAVLSPQNDWFNNVSLAERVMEVTTKYADTKITREIVDKAIANNLDKRTQKPNKFAKLAEKFFKKHGEVSINDFKAGVGDNQGIILRIFDHAFHSPKIPMTDPTGKFIGYDTTPVRWKGYDDIAKAVAIFKDGSMDNINRNLGNGNKVRNFYNNQVDPFSQVPYVTADTHALSAALGIPASAKDANGFGLFNGSKEPIYAIVKEAYINAAAVTGLLPREMQSITWEAQRIGINNKNRTAVQKKNIFDIILKTRIDEKTPYERAAELIRTHRSADPIWGRSSGIRTQKEDNELGRELKNKADEAIRALYDIRRRPGGRMGRTDSGLGRETTGGRYVGGPITPTQELPDVEMAQQNFEEERADKLARAVTAMRVRGLTPEYLYNELKDIFDSFNISFDELQRAISDETITGFGVEEPIKDVPSEENNFNAVVRRMLESPLYTTEEKELLKKAATSKVAIKTEELKETAELFIRDVATLEDIQAKSKALWYNISRWAVSEDDRSGWEFIALQDLGQMALALGDADFWARNEAQINQKAADIGRLLYTLRGIYNTYEVSMDYRRAAYSHLFVRDPDTNTTGWDNLQEFLFGKKENGVRQDTIKANPEEINKFIRAINTRTRMILDKLVLSQKGEEDIENFLNSIKNPKTKSSRATNLLVNALVTYRASQKKASGISNIRKDLEADIRNKALTILELTKAKNYALHESGLTNAEKAIMANRIDDIITSVTGNNFGTSLMRKQLKEQLGIEGRKKLQDKLIEIARDRVTKKNVSTKLIEEIITKTGLTAESAKIAEDLISDVFDKVLSEALGKRILEAAHKLIWKDVTGLKTRIEKLDPVKDKREIRKLEKRIEFLEDRARKAEEAMSMASYSLRKELDNLTEQKKALRKEQEDIKLDPKSTDGKEKARKLKDIDERLSKLNKEYNKIYAHFEEEARKRGQEHYEEAKIKLENTKVRLADLITDTMLSDEERQLEKLMLIKQRNDLTDAIKDYESKDANKKRKAQAALMYLIVRPRTYKNLIEILKKGVWDHENVMNYFSEVNGFSMTEDDVVLIKSYMDIVNPDNNYSTAAKKEALRKVFEFFADKRERAAFEREGFLKRLLENHKEYQYTNYLSSVGSALKVTTQASLEIVRLLIGEPVNILTFALLHPKYLSADLKNIAKAASLGAKNFVATLPELRAAALKGESIAQLDEIETNKLLNKGQVLSRASLYYLNTYLENKSLIAKYPHRFIATVLWATFSTTARLLTVSDMMVKSFSIPYFRLRHGFYEAVRTQRTGTEEEKKAAGVDEFSAIYHIDKLLSINNPDNNLRGAVRKLEVKADEFVKAGVFTKNSIELAQIKGYPIDSKGRKFTGRTLDNWRIRTEQELLPDFLTEQIGKAADTSALSDARTITATGDVYGTVSQIISMVMALEENKIGSQLKFVVLPFAKATGTMINLIWSMLPVNVLQSRIDVDGNYSYGLTGIKEAINQLSDADKKKFYMRASTAFGGFLGLQLRDEKRSYDAKGKLVYQRELAAGEIFKNRVHALLSTATVSAIFFTFFEFGPCANVEEGTCLKLRDKKLRITGNKKYEMNNEAFYGDGWQPSAIQKYNAKKEKWETVFSFKDRAIGALLSGFGQASDHIRFDPNASRDSRFSTFIADWLGGTSHYGLNFGWAGALQTIGRLNDLISDETTGSKMEKAFAELENQLTRANLPGSGFMTTIEDFKDLPFLSTAFTEREKHDYRVPETEAAKVMSNFEILGFAPFRGASQAISQYTPFDKMYGMAYDPLNYPIVNDGRTWVSEYLFQPPDTPKGWKLIGKFAEAANEIRHFNYYDTSETENKDKYYEEIYAYMPVEYIDQMRKRAAEVKQRMMNNAYPYLKSVRDPKVLKEVLKEVNTKANQHAFVDVLFKNVVGLKKILDENDFNKLNKTAKAPYIGETYSKSALTDILFDHKKKIYKGKLINDNSAESRTVKEFQQEVKKTKIGED